MTKEYKWLFPSGSVGITGINHSGIETFKDHPIPSLGREICQNSGDAVNDKDKPVIVEFHLFKIKTEDFPDIEGMRDAIRRCNAFWKSQDNPKATAFFATANRIVNAEEMTILRISDHNTVGLDGADRLDDTTAHWTSLVMSTGTSSKDGSTEGGSFGIGKFAAFANSKIRTVFYSTVDKSGHCASEGISYLATFKDDNGTNTIGTGYCGKNNGPIFSQLELDPKYHRTVGDPGTDLYICGFSNASGWNNQLTASIIDSFFYAIDKNYLVVDVDGIKVDSKSLDSIIEKYKNQCDPVTQDYFEVVRDEGDYISVDDFDGNKNSLHLKFLIKPGMNRKVAMIRKTGMKIFDQGGFNSNISFAGIMYVSNEKSNKFLTSLENPQHKQWLYERDENDPEHAKKYLADIRKKIRDELQKLIEKNYSGQVIPETGGFLQSIDSGKGKKNKQDILTDQPLELKPKEYNAVPKTIPAVIEEEGAGGDDIGSEGGKDYGTDEGGGGHSYGTGHGGNGPRGENSGTETNGNASGSNKRVNNCVIPLLSRRLIGIDVANGKYLYKLKPAKSSDNAEIKISVSAEDGTYPPDVESIIINNQPDVNVNGGIITGVKMIAGQTLTIIMKIHASDYLSFEVSCSETENR